MPAAVWGTKQPTNTPTADLLPDALLTGILTLAPPAPTLTPTQTVFIPSSRFAFTEVAKGTLFITSAALNAPVNGIGASFPTITGTSLSGVASGEARQRRGKLIALAQSKGFDALPDDDLTVLAANATNHTLLQSDPMLGPLGSGGTPQHGLKRPEPLPEPAAPAEVIETVVRFLVSILQYRYVGSTTTSTSAVGVTTTELTGTAVLTKTPPGPAQPAQNPPPASPDAPPATVTQKAPPQEIVTAESLVLSMEHSKPSQALQPALSLTCVSGALRFRVTSFDSFGVLVEDDTLPHAADIATAKAGAVFKKSLSRAAARVIVTAVPLPPPPPVVGLAAPPSTTTFGWTTSTALVQAQPRVFLFEGGSVRTQGSVDAAAGIQGPLDDTTGLVRGGDAVAGNVVTTAGGVAQSGAFRTLLPADVRTLAVLVHKSGVPAQAGLGTDVRVTTADGVEHRLIPLHVVPDDPGVFVLLYKLPDALQIEATTSANPDPKITVLTQAIASGDAAGSWEIQGVVGIREKVHRVSAHWSDFKLKAPAPVQSDPSAPAQQPQLGKVEVVAA
jgi:hypothetical protein